MNADTGQIYEGEGQIEAAKTRGERLIELSPRVLEQMQEPRLNRAQRRAQKFKRGHHAHARSAATR